MDKVSLIEVSPEMTEACLAAVATWGQDARLTQSSGECGEFMAAFGRYVAAIGRYFQGRDPLLEDVAKEAADVVILMMQIREMVGAETFDKTLEVKFAKFCKKISEKRFPS